jgi:hypothetical protein
VVFAGFALFIWWRLVKDDYRRDLEEQFDGGEGTHGEHGHLPPTPPEHTQQKVQP